MEAKHPSMLDLLLETHIDLERQGPGSSEAIEQALGFLKPFNRFSEIADLGCGTGILAIAALKLGAAQAVGVDIDPICEQVTARHCQLNNVSAAQFHFHCGNILEDQQLQQQLASNSYQLVIANINADIVCRLAALAKTLLSPQGVCLSSGILDMYSDQVETALAEAGLRIVEHLHQGEWNAYAAIAD